MGIIWEVAWAYNGLGRLYSVQNADSRSWAYFQQALQAARNAPFIPEVLDVLTSMALLLARAGQTAQAIRLLCPPLWDARHRQRTWIRAQQLAADLGLQTIDAHLEADWQLNAQARLEEAICIAVATTL
jgi:hypothetical protein